MKSLKYHLEGVATLLMHSDVAANPLNHYAKAQKEITSKRKKTDEDHERLAKLDFLASLYYSESKGYHIPANCIDATFLTSSKMFKLGTTWKQAAFVENDAPFVFPNRDLHPDELYLFENGLYRDMRTVKIGTAKTVRCRPAFNVWSFDTTIIIDESKLNERQIDQIVENAGKYVGICDYRPRFGRFNVTKLK
jgi:hypothetical protein